MAAEKGQDWHAHLGGVHFTQQASTEQINQFVRRLPEQKRDSLFEVLDELNQAGLIQIKNDGQFSDPHGNLHGTTGCYEDEK